MTRIGFIRHGSTSWNKEGRAQGNSDISLDADGFAEAGKLAERLRIEQWDVLFSSDLLRAKQTADVIAQAMEHLQIHVDPRLREVGGGQIEGTTEKERVQKWGPNWREQDVGIESKESVLARGLAVLEEITSAHAGQNILLVSHGSFIKHLLVELVPHSCQNLSLHNTSVTNIQKSENGWVVELLNCTKHLEQG